MHKSLYTNSVNAHVGDQVKLACDNNDFLWQVELIIALINTLLHVLYTQQIFL